MNPNTPMDAPSRELRGERAWLLVLFFVGGFVAHNALARAELRSMVDRLEYAEAAVQTAHRQIDSLTDCRVRGFTNLAEAGHD